MDNIAELERRITAALVKIDRGIEAYASAQDAKLGALVQAVANTKAEAEEQIAAAEQAAAEAALDAAAAVELATEAAAEAAAAEQAQGMPVATLADGVAEAEIARLNEALDEERFNVSQLHERLRAARQKEAVLEQEAGAKAAFETEIARQSHLLEQQSVEMGRLKAAVTALRNELRHLREASLQGSVDVDMINASMVAELEAMRAERAAEAVELRELLAALDPLALVQEEGAENA